VSSPDEGDDACRTYVDEGVSIKAASLVDKDAVADTDQPGAPSGGQPVQLQQRHVRVHRPRRLMAATPCSTNKAKFSERSAPELALIAKSPDLIKE